jgi:hypothetical protein
MPSAEQYAAGGYYEVEEAEKPEPKKWFSVVAKYATVDAGERSYTIKHTVTDDAGNETTTEEVFNVEVKKIVQSWDYVKDERPDYGELIVGYIRERYSINDELAIQRQWDNSAEKKQEFNEYNAFCDDCKIKAKADIAEWEATDVD